MTQLAYSEIQRMISSCSLNRFWTLPFNFSCSSLCRWDIPVVRRKASKTALNFSSVILSIWSNLSINLRFGESCLHRRSILSRLSTPSVSLCFSLGISTYVSSWISFSHKCSISTGRTRVAFCKSREKKIQNVNNTKANKYKEAFKCAAMDSNAAFF